MIFHRMNRKTVLCFMFLLLVSPIWAQEAFSFSGQISEEGGIFQAAQSALQPYQLSRLLAQSHGEFDSEFSWDLEAEAGQQSSSTGLAPTWLTYTKQNYVNLEADNVNSNTSYAMVRLDRTFLKWISGRIEVSAGLQSFDGGTAYFYQPTHYFNPLPALAWVSDETLGCEGLQTNCFLLDDLSVEGEVRFLADGSSEWVARLVNKGIGIAITPSFAWLNGRNGAGLELSGTFPDFQVRFDGVNWFYVDGRAQLEWVAGVSSLVQGTKFTLEGLQDTNGDALGGWTAGNPDSFYLFASAQRDFSGQWQANPTLVKSINGGPLLLWPKISWSWNRDWKLTAQAQWPLGATDGALGLYPSRSGLSLAFLF
ncbi:MAG TPA: hypothetical protein VK791_12090 [bacterium]|jgi:hypothetical protein|nr:hypothetical protein [bacterium]